MPTAPSVPGASSDAKIVCAPDGDGEADCVEEEEQEEDARVLESRKLGIEPECVSRMSCKRSNIVSTNSFLRFLRRGFAEPPYVSAAVSMRSADHLPEACAAIASIMRAKSSSASRIAIARSALSPRQHLSIDAACARSSCSVNAAAGGVAMPLLPNSDADPGVCIAFFSLMYVYCTLGFLFVPSANPDCVVVPVGVVLADVLARSGVR